MRKALLIVGALLGVGVLGLFGCAAVRLPDVSLSVTGEAAEPPVLAAFQDDPPVDSVDAWEQRRAPLLRESFLANVYGRLPADATATVTNRRMLDAAAYGGTVQIEELTVTLEGGVTGSYNVLLILPVGAENAPVIIMQNFCGNPAVFPDLPVSAPRYGGCEASGWQRALIETIFGSAIITPPVQDIIARGYGIAEYFAGEVVPDDAEQATPILDAITPPGTPPEQRTSAIGAWAWTYSRTIDALSGTPGVDPARFVAWGHSRNGKAALLAAAFDPRIAGVVALQPGTAGASLQRNAVGESIQQITESYPHWFAPAYAAFAERTDALPVDQHQLLALLAPRPVLIGMARRDQWSDPHGAFLAVEGAAPAYALYGAPPFSQDSLRHAVLAHPLGYFMRGGLHGVHASDWDETLDFLDARLRPVALAAPQPSEP
jgi:hypothetical protein